MRIKGMHKIMVVFGTRPEALKCAPLLVRLRQARHFFTTIAVNTGQHKDLLDPMFSFLRIRPDYNLGIMRENQDSTVILNTLTTKITSILRKEKPGLVLVQGDTSSAFIACLCAFYLRIPVGHIEAGLRTYDNLAPFPEEANRRLIDALATLHFAPTSVARRNLLKEGVARKNIFVVGNTGIDTLLYFRRAMPKIIPRMYRGIDFNKKLILVTVHRQENFGKPLLSICRAVNKIAAEEQDVEIAVPLHPNPNVREVVRSFLEKTDRVHLLPPINYPMFVFLLSRSYLILTDSGGIQEEAPYFRKPVLVLREKTERVEGITAGVAQLVGTNERTIIRNVRALLRDRKKYAMMRRVVRPYGNGSAADKIVKILIREL